MVWPLPKFPGRLAGACPTARALGVWGHWDRNRVRMLGVARGVVSGQVAARAWLAGAGLVMKRPERRHAGHPPNTSG
jgi:hypothetical protein